MDLNPPAELPDSVLNWPWVVSKYLHPVKVLIRDPPKTK